METIALYILAVIAILAIPYAFSWLGEALFDQKPDEGDMVEMKGEPLDDEERR